MLAHVGIHDKIDDWMLGDLYSRPEVVRTLYEIFLVDIPLKNKSKHNVIFCGEFLIR